ncbi:polysaccharide pyruvyl transferase family protein [Streptomyces montanisoli]|uniref:polysaccharide pyruvyl transferase family protein n=1 Tax=Streptomyces montanisoli TaxID=2798581 RepID=UPI0027DE186C|nr:polysaccharide pyruvyl transferase family protein [Streptomyces montanisoli]
MTDLTSQLLAELRSPSEPARRTLVTGWFSFLDGEVTAGDALACRRVEAALGAAGLAYDTAWSPVFAPGALSLADADPSAYDVLLFVCGPIHGEQVERLHSRFSGCRRIAAGVSVVDPADPAVTGFHTVVARDGGDPWPRPDLALTAPLGPLPPVAGVALTFGQGEYGAGRRHEAVGEALTRWLGRQDCARVDADTRLDSGDWRRPATAEQYLALVSRLDIVVTTRLHGLVLALRAGTPVLAVDPVEGGAKVTAQARALGWPALLGAGEVDDAHLDRWWRWCLSPDGREAARSAAREER